MFYTIATEPNLMKRLFLLLSLTAPLGALQTTKPSIRASSHPIPNPALTGLGPGTWIRHQWASGTIRETTSEGSADSSSTDCHRAPPQPPHPIRPNGPPVKTYPLTPTITTAPWNSTHVEDFAAGPRCSRPPVGTAQAASIHLTFDY